MPGNEVGDRIHNFFGQDNLSQGQRQSKAVDRTWPALSNNLWGGSLRQTSAPLISSYKSHNIQQSADSERRQGGQSSSVQHGVHFPQSILRPEFPRGQPQSQQPNLNGYVRGHQVLQTMQNEANLLGVDTETDGHNLTSRGFSVIDSQLGNGPEFPKISTGRMDFNESPVNYDFFGGEQQTSGHHTGNLQFPTQQSGISDMQLLQQQVMLKQMQEYQRQQQLQKQQLLNQESRQLNSVNQLSPFAKQAAGSYSTALINGVPVHDASSYSWQPDLIAANATWSQRSESQQGSSSGLRYSLDQGQASHLMGVAPQQVDQSLYGVPVSGTRVTPGQYSPMQMDKPTIQQISGSSNSFPSNKCAGFNDQSSLQDSTLASRPRYQGKNMVGTSDGRGLNTGFNLENLQQVSHHKSDRPVPESHERRELPGPSGTSQEKTVMQVPPAHNVATLDPTEEKILFGSDDNLWETFGRGTTIGSGGYTMMGGADSFGAFPSVQSGSWSALMQSAVAETSSGDVRPQEEWSGLTFQNSESRVGYQDNPTAQENSSHQSIRLDNSSHTDSGQNSKPFSQSDDSNKNVNYNNIQGVQQSGVYVSCEQSERLQTGSSQSFIQQFPAEAKWPDHGVPQKVVAESSHGNVAYSSDAEFSAKSLSGPWMNQPRIRSGGQTCSRTSGWNFIDSAAPSLGAALKSQGDENSLQTSQRTDQRSPMFDIMHRSKNDLISGSVELEHVKSTTGSPQVSMENSNLNALPDWNTVRASQNGNEQLTNCNNIDVWKCIDLLMDARGIEIPGKYQPRMDKSHQTFGTSGTGSSGDGTVETHEMLNLSNKQNATDCSRNISYHASVDGVRNNAWIDDDSHTLHAGKQKSSSHIVRKPSGVRKFQYHPMGDLDVEVEPSYGAKHIPYSQSMMQQASQGLKSHDQGYIGQPKFPGHMAKNSMEIEKGGFSGRDGEIKSLSEISSKTMLSGYEPSTSTHFDKALHNNAPNRTMASSENMLELLQKVDQSGKSGNATHTDPNHTSEKAEAETSEGFVHLRQNQASTSQGFGLQLAPPSQRLPVSDHAFSSQSLSENISSNAAVASDVGEKGRGWLASSFSDKSFPSSLETSHGELGNNSSAQTSKNANGNFSAVSSPALPYARSHLQNQHMTHTSGQATAGQAAHAFDMFASQARQNNKSFERAQPSQSALGAVPDTSRSTLHNDIGPSADTAQLSRYDQSHMKDSAQQFPVLEAAPAQPPYSLSDMSQDGGSTKLPPALGIAISSQLPSFAGQPFRPPSNMYMSNLQSKDNSETTFSRILKVEDQTAQTGGNGLSESAACSGNSHSFGKEQALKGDNWHQVSPENDPAQKSMSDSQGKESAANRPTGTSISKPTSTQKEVEAFGRSLRSSTILHQNYTLQHQMAISKDAGVDLGNQSLKRFKGPDGPVDAQLVAPHGGLQFNGHNNMIKDVSTDHTSIPSGDSEVLSFSTKPTDSTDANALSQDVLTIGQNDSHNLTSSNNAAPVRGGHSQISPQMAPSWFGQYRSFKNGQMVPIHDAQRSAIMKNAELPCNAGRTFDGLPAHMSMGQRNAAVAADASQFSIIHKTPALPSVASECFSSPQLLGTDSAGVSLVVARPKRRKNATFDLVPWHKEVIQGPARLQNISMAEAEWALAANRLTEKVEDETEIMGDGSPVVRSKKRLLLTTQLMQQLLQPPMASVFSADAVSHYESIVYFVTRSTSGDACNALCCARNGTSEPSSSGNSQSATPKAPERIRDQYFSKVTEDLANRATKLENDLLRLDNGASFLDLRLECQDQERFSVINRFAKFHGRSQADGAETISSSEAHRNAERSCLRKYVTALPMPRNLPDRVPCLLL